MSESISTNPIKITRRSLIRHSLRLYRRFNIGIVSALVASGLAWLLIPKNGSLSLFSGIMAIYCIILILVMLVGLVSRFSKGSIALEGKEITYTFTPESACQKANVDFEAKFKLETLYAYAVTEGAIYLYLSRRQCLTVDFKTFATDQDRQMVIQWLQAKGIKRKKV